MDEFRMGLIEAETQNPALDNGDINPMVFRHQGMILSHFVEDGGKGLRAGLFDFAREVSTTTFKRALIYEERGVEKLKKDVIVFLTRAGLEYDLEDEDDINKILKQYDMSIVGIPMYIKLCTIVGVIAKNMNAYDWFEKFTIDEHKLMDHVKSVLSWESQVP